MATLLLDAGRSVTLEIADTRSTRRRGLLGRDSVGEGALLLTKCRSVHTMGMRFPIDVAHLSTSMSVLKVTTMPVGRVGRPVWRARHVLEADAGAFARWGLAVGDVVTVVP
jgi:uncharacterized protein